MISAHQRLLKQLPPIRRGITLMEVLISIGILSVGLTTVVALIPAGGTEARRAVMEDRRASVSLAGLNDAVIRGVLNTRSWSTVPPNPYRVTIDPLGGASLGLDEISFASLSGLPAAVVFQGEDDVSYSLENAGQEAPPIPLFFNSNARRLSEGNYTWLATLTPAPPTAAGGVNTSQNYRLTVCTCYKRPESGGVSSFALAAPPAGLPVSRSVQFPCPLGTDAFRKLFPRGGVVFLEDTTNGGVETYDWRRILFASIDTATNTAEIMFDKPTLAAAGATLYGIEGAVGVAEKVVRLEGVSPWTQ